MSKKQVRYPEPEIDFIGGQGQLSQEEEIALSVYFKSKRNTIAKTLSKRKFIKRKPEKSS